MGYNSWMLGIQSNKNQGQILDSEASTFIPNFWRIIIQPSKPQVLQKCFANGWKHNTRNQGCQGKSLFGYPIEHYMLNINIFWLKFDFIWYIYYAFMPSIT
jgi:hypothetical protein